MTNIEKNAEKIADIALKKWNENKKQRVLMAIAGPPGSGKSTLAERAVAIIKNESAVDAALVPMDGYHYDNDILKVMGRIQFKGAIDTFDAHGLRYMLQRLKTNEDDTVAIPMFDRSIEMAKAGAKLIPQSTDIIICEGNYLLSSVQPWDRLKPIFDFTIFIDVEPNELKQRLQARWRSLGFDETEVNRRVDENDLPNGMFIIRTALYPDLYIKN